VKRNDARCAVGMVLLVLLLSAPWAAHARTFVVSPQGNDQNPGTLEQPWRTMYKANVNLQPGDTVLVRGGTYQEQIKPVNDGVSGSPIVYAAMPGETVVIEGEPGNLVVVVASSYSIIEGFTIRCQAYLQVLKTPEYWIHLVGNHITLRHCRVLADGDAAFNYGTLQAFSRGIVVSGQHNLVEHCYVRGQMMGVVIGGGLPRFATLRYDTLVNHGSSNIVILPHEDQGRFDPSMQGTLIEDCVMDTSWDEDNIQFEPNYLDRSQTYNNGVIIRRSRLGHAAENCIDFKGAGYVLVDGCLLYSSEGNDNGHFDGPDDIGGAGLNLGNGEISRYVIVRRSVLWDNHTGAFMFDGYRYYNNVFLNNRRSYRGSNGDYTNADFSGVRIWNKKGYKRDFLNNIIGMQPNSGVLNLDLDYGADFALDNNLYFDAEGPAKFYHSMTNPKTTTRGLSEWKDILNTYGGYAYLEGKEVNSVEADPQFVNVPLYPVDFDESWNFGLGSNSPAINAGRPVTTAIGDGSGSRTLRVADARFFCDGFGVTGGDVIKIGSDAPVQIVSIDTTLNTITLAESRFWVSGAGVHIAYEGEAPDIGAREFVQGVGQAPSSPQPASPADGTGSLPLSVQVTWHKVADASAYYTQVATNSSFSSLIRNVGPLTDTSLAVSNLSGNTTYYWRVRSGNASGLSAWSAVSSFTTANTGVIPSVPVTEGPVSGTTGVTTNPLLTWQGVPGAQSYGVQVSASPSFATLKMDRSGITGTNVQVDGLTNGMEYYWRVNATGSGGTSAWSAVSSFTTASIVVLPNVPVTEAPASGTTGITTNPLLTWYGVPGAQSYGVQVSTSLSFEELQLDRSGITGTSVLVDGLRNGTEYYWRVNAMGSGGSSAWSRVVALTTFSLPTTMAANGVSNADFNNGTTGWSFATSGAGLLEVTSPGYKSDNAARITIAQAGTGAQLFQNDLILHPESTYRLNFAAKSGGGNDCDVTVLKSGPPDLPYGLAGKHFDLGTDWKMYSVDFTPDNFSSPVNDGRLRFEFGTSAPATDVYYVDDVRLLAINPSTPPPPPPGEVPADYFLDEIYPNPFNPATTIRYSLPADVHVVIRIYNLLGQLVMTHVDGIQTAGTHEVRLNMEGYVSGMYLCTLQAGEYRQTRKLMYVK